MGAKRRVDVLLALLGTTPEEPLSGSQVTERLASEGRRIGPASLLSTLLELEASGHVLVTRQPEYRFWLSPAGQQAAYEVGPGQAVELNVVMVDLVGFTTYTASHGDHAARDAAHLLHNVGSDELGSLGGRVVKSLGDGILGIAPPSTDVVSAIQRIRGRVSGVDGSPWPLRAGLHQGRPIEHRGDVFGADVNLAARLCSEASPDELVRSVDPSIAGHELIQVRGLTDPVPIVRVALV